MNDKITANLQNIVTYTDALMKIPANEENIGNIQGVISIALLEIKQCLEVMSKTKCDVRDWDSVP